MTRAEWRTDLALTTTGGATAAFFSTHAATLTVVEAGTDNVSSTGGPAIDITGSGTFDFDDVDSTNSTTDGINLASLGTSTFSADNTSAITNAAGIDFDLDSGTGAVTYAGTITDDVGQLVRVANTTGGTKDFNGLTDNYTVNVSNNTFSSHGGDHVNVTMINSAVIDITISGNTMTGGHATGLGQGIFVFGASWNGTGTYDIANNSINGNRQGGAIHTNKGSGTATMSGTISGNVIGTSGVTLSGSLEASGIVVGSRGAGGSHTVLVTNNQVRQFNDRGIILEVGEGNASLNATVTGNTVAEPGSPALNSLHGLHVDMGINAGDAGSVCLDIGGAGAASNNSPTPEPKPSEASTSASAAARRSTSSSGATPVAVKTTPPSTPTCSGETPPRPPVPRAPAPARPATRPAGRPS